MSSITRLGRLGPRILLIHGLYSSPGAWVSTLSRFGLARIELLHADYHLAITNNSLKEMADELSATLEHEFDLVVSHSFGTVLAGMMTLTSKRAVFIAPPFLATSFDIDSYVKTVSASSKRPKEEVYDIASGAIKIVSSHVFAVNESDLILLPRFDEFFTYDSKRCGVNYFHGTHTDLEPAVELAVKEGFLESL